MRFETLYAYAAAYNLILQHCEEVWEAWIMQARSQGKLKAVYCSREEQEMKLPHILANKGRLFGWEKHGSDEPVFNS